MNSSTVWVVQLPQLAELSDPLAALDKLAHEHGVYATFFHTPAYPPYNVHCKVPRAWTSGKP